LGGFNKWTEVDFVADMGTSLIVVFLFYEACWRDRFEEEDIETHDLFKRLGEVPWSIGSIASFIESSCDDFIIAT
jgi:hypothetical protein